MPATDEIATAVDAAEEAAWLLDRRRRMERDEAEWLLALARFDRNRTWEVDGQLSCVEWLQWRAGMARATAFEKLRVAKALEQRPVLLAALQEGRVSYCAVRAMVRAEGTTWETDEAFVQVAESGTVADVERVVHLYCRYRQQDDPPAEHRPRRGVRVRACGQGYRKVEAILTDLEATELEAALTPRRTETRASAPTSTTTGPADPAPDGQRVRTDIRHTEAETQSWMEQRADALMELSRQALRARSDGSDRYLVHIVVRDGRATLVDGTPLAMQAASKLLCDSSWVVHEVDAQGTPLRLGRKQRSWTTAQRRAVAVRDGGRCRWPGCERTSTDVHHVRFWERGGPTDTGNGILLCPQHHTKIHEHGFFTTGDPSSTLSFHQPLGVVLGESRVAAYHYDDRLWSSSAGGSNVSRETKDACVG